jgi:small subunit ribosomal protein S20
MPLTSSAKKAHKQSLVRASRNRRFSDLYKETLKTFERALKAGNVEEATTALSKLYSRVDTLVKKNILHKNNAARKKSCFCKDALKAASRKIISTRMRRTIDLHSRKKSP